MTKFRRKLNKLGKWPAIISTFLLVFFIGSRVGMKVIEDKYEAKYANPVRAYYVVDPTIMDKVPNAGPDLYITGEVRAGNCYPIK